MADTVGSFSRVLRSLLLVTAGFAPTVPAAASDGAKMYRSKEFPFYVFLIPADSSAVRQCLVQAAGVDAQAPMQIVEEGGVKVERTVFSASYGTLDIVSGNGWTRAKMTGPPFMGLSFTKSAKDVGLNKLAGCMDLGKGRPNPGDMPTPPALGMSPLPPIQTTYGATLMAACLARHDGPDDAMSSQSWITPDGVYQIGWYRSRTMARDMERIRFAHRVVPTAQGSRIEIYRDDRAAYLDPYAVGLARRCSEHLDADYLPPPSSKAGGTALPGG